MTKKETKRQAILDTAYKLFQAQGFEKTSMSEINTLVGGSKATIYSHFHSKEELFVECMMAATEEYIVNIITLVDKSGNDPQIVLTEFGERFLGFICSSGMVAMRRLLIAEGNRFGIGKLFFAKIMALRAHVSALMSRFMSMGTLRDDDPQLAADQLRALLEAELLESLLLEARNDTPDQQEITLAVQRAITTFLRAYAPVTNSN